MKTTILAVLSALVLLVAVDVWAQDADGDGVLDDVDLCPNTVVPESVPTDRLLPNHCAVTTASLNFTCQPKKGKGKGNAQEFTLTDTHGCTCAQIVAAEGLGSGSLKHGCSKGVLRSWINQNDED